MNSRREFLAAGGAKGLHAALSQDEQSFAGFSGAKQRFCATRMLVPVEGRISEQGHTLSSMKDSLSCGVWFRGYNAAGISEA